MAYPWCLFSPVLLILVSATISLPDIQATSPCHSGLHLLYFLYLVIALRAFFLKKEIKLLIYINSFNFILSAIISIQANISFLLLYKIKKKILYMCVSTCLCTHICVHMWACGGQEPTSGVFLYCFPPYLGG